MKRKRLPPKKPRRRIKAARVRHVAGSITPKQARFVAEYLVDLNGADAATRVGCNPKNARVQAAKWLANPNVADLVAKGKAAQLAKLDVDAARVLLELGRLSVSDLRACFDAQGQLKPIGDLPDDVAAAISSVEVIKRPTGDKNEPFEYIHKIRLWDKNAALGNLAKHYKLLTDNINLKGDLTVTQQAAEDVPRMSDAALAKATALNAELMALIRGKA